MNSDWDGTGKSPMLYSKTATGAINFWQCWADGGSVVVRWGQMDGAIQTASFRCEPKNEGRANATTAEQQAIKEAAAKWQKMLKKKYSTSLETAGETKRIKPMLALDLNKRTKPLEYPVYVQPKLDGVRCLAYRSQDAGGRVVLQSRGGDFYDVEHIRSELESCLTHDVILDGELYLHGVSLQTITSLVRRPQVESSGLWYCIYDMTNVGHNLGGFGERHLHIRRFFITYQRTFIKIAEVSTMLASCEAVVQGFVGHHEGEGYEGGIIRTQSGIYREGYRSPDLLKKKSWEDAEFRIVNWAVGKGKFENAPIFTCVTPDGKEFEVVPTGTASERYAMLQAATSYIGRLLTVKYLGLTDEGKPKCARGIAIREESDLS